ncbi:MAG TPA: VOC family protein [Burkholderiales bacterium]|nr:VOC family protein [Burkholderiales bacterium]
MVRYRKLGYVAVNVTDIERSCAFYESIVGFQPNGRGPDGAAYFRFGRSHHDLVLYPAARAGFKRLGWELEDEKQFDALERALSRHGMALKEVDAAECAALRQGRTVRFSDPFSGCTWEFYARMGAEETPFTPRVVRFDRVGHAILKTPRFEEALRFYTDVLNFRLSDKVEGVIAFLRAFPNPYHHTFGIAAAERHGLHHVNFMLSSIDDWGRCTARLPREQVPVVWGPGRHTNAGTFFLYYLDPDGLTLEYGHGMEEFPEVGAREPNVRAPGQEAVDLWDSPMDPRTCASGEVEAVA